MPPCAVVQLPWKKHQCLGVLLSARDRCPPLLLAPVLSAAAHCCMQALTKQVTDTVSLQAQIEGQQSTIDSLQEALSQLEQLHASKEELCGTLQEGNSRLREQLELEQALRKRADKVSEVSGC